MQKIFNPSSFASELSPQHKIWVQSVHKALTDIITQLKITETSMLDRSGGPNDNVSVVSSNTRSSHGTKRS